MSEVRYKLVARSTNRKVGPCAVVQAHSGTCPLTCPLRHCCYAQYSWLAGQQAKLDAGLRGVSFAELLKQVSALPSGQLIRWGDAGDLPGMGNAINEGQLWALATAMLGKLCWAYTHKPVLKRRIRNRRVLSKLNGGPLVVNLSAEGWNKADALYDLGIAPVVTVLPRSMVRDDWTMYETRKGRKIIRCPAEYNNRITCHSCGGRRAPLCARWDRTSIVGFTSHGTGWKKTDQVIAEVEMGLIGWD